MSHLIKFIENVRSNLNRDEWVFFNARYIERKSVTDSAALARANAGDAMDLQQTVLRKLRSGVAS